MARILSAENKAPGTYITEFDNSQVAEQSNSQIYTAVFYGFAKSGPVGVPTLITSPGQFLNTFGKPQLNWGVEESHGTWTAYNYLATGVGPIWFIRVSGTGSPVNKLRYKAIPFTSVSLPSTTLSNIEYSTTTDSTALFTNTKTLQENLLSSTNLYFTSKYPKYTTFDAKELSTYVVFSDIGDPSGSTVTNREKLTFNAALTISNLNTIEIGSGTASTATGDLAIEVPAGAFSAPLSGGNITAGDFVVVAKVKDGQVLSGTPSITVNGKAYFNVTITLSAPTAITVNGEPAVSVTATVKSVTAITWTADQTQTYLEFRTNGYTAIDATGVTVTPKNQTAGDIDGDSNVTTANNIFRLYPRTSELSKLGTLQEIQAYRWKKVYIMGKDADATSDAPFKILETRIVNDSRQPLSSGQSYWVGDLTTKSVYLNAFVGADVTQDDETTALNNFFGQTFGVQVESILTQNVTALGSWYPLFDSDAADDSALAFSMASRYVVDSANPVPMIYRSEYPFIEMFISGDSSLNKVAAVKNIIKKNNYMVYAALNMGDKANSMALFTNTKDVTFNSGKEEWAGANLNPSFGAEESYVFKYFGFTQVFDPFTGRNYYLPHSTQAFLNIGALNNVPWLAPAGEQRGVISALKVVPELSDEQLGLLYNQYKLNCISKSRNGYSTWGQRTAQKYASARDRINVRRTLIDIENVLEQGLRQFLWSNASATTVERMNQFMKSVANFYLKNDAVKAFKYQLDFTNIQYNQVDVIVKVMPMEAIEYINVELTVTRDALSVGES